MPMMEQVHQRTSKYEQVRKDTEQVRPMFGKEKKACDEQEAD